MLKTRYRSGPGKLGKICALLWASVALPFVANNALAADLESDLSWLTVPAAETDPARNPWASLGGAWNSDTESFGEFVRMRHSSPPR